MDAVRITHAALDVEGDNLILRGRLDPQAIKLLRIDDYQREVMPLSTIRELMEGFKTGSVPDIDLGLRGENASCVSKDEHGESWVLRDPVYIVDGLQRVSAAQQLMLEGILPRLGATVHFSTTREWERGRFKILNADRIKLSPNILLRNLREQYPVIALLHAMSADDPAFTMRGHICWSQRMKREHFIAALSLLKVVGTLHSYIHPGGLYVNLYELAPGVQGITDKIGRNTFRSNVRAFFQLVDESWGVRTVSFKEGAAYLRTSFLITLARVLSRHENFWREYNIEIGTDWGRRFASFPVHDPTVRQLAGSSGKAREMLFAMLVDHLNRGKRTHRLRPRRR